MIVSGMVSAGRRVVVGVATWVAGQERALTNARRASTEVSRRRVEREAIAIRLDDLQPSDPGASSAGEWPGTSAGR